MLQSKVAERTLEFMIHLKQKMIIKCSKKYAAMQTIEK